jgi:hypothetical protein
MTERAVAARLRASAVITVCDGGEFLAEAIDSVQARSFSGWELREPRDRPGARELPTALPDHGPCGRHTGMASILEGL